MSPKRRAAPGTIVLRAIIALAVLGVIVFAVEGGEWGTVDLLRQRTRLARMRREVDSLSRTVDSLKKYKHLLLTDPVTQEKVAREEFGMVKGNKEILYRFTEADSAVRKAAAPTKR